MSQPAKRTTSDFVEHLNKFCVDQIQWILGLSAFIFFYIKTNSQILLGLIIFLVVAYNWINSKRADLFLKNEVFTRIDLVSSPKVRIPTYLLTLVLVSVLQITLLTLIAWAVMDGVEAQAL